MAHWVSSNNTPSENLKKILVDVNAVLRLFKAVKEVDINRCGTAGVTTVSKRDNRLVQKEKKKMKMKVFAVLMAVLFCMTVIGYAQEDEKKDQPEKEVIPQQSCLNLIQIPIGSRST